MSKENGNILVVDDDDGILLSARVSLKKQFKNVIVLNDPSDLLSIIQRHDFHVVMLDMNYNSGDTSGKEGLKLLKQIVELNREIQVVMITAYGDIDLAVSAMKLGAVDFVVKPWDNTKLVATIRSAYKLCETKREVLRLKEEHKSIQQLSDETEKLLVGNSAQMLDLKEQIKKLAQTDANVLLIGENGTGKDVVAKLIHAESSRANQVFVSVDLGAISESVFESELFGHVKGAFTDAHQDRQGRFKAAHRGTLFLDEIGNLELKLQAKLLTAIQKKEVMALGNDYAESVDVRIISATNMPVYEMVEKGEFRQDLLYRINTVELKIPPLRERMGDVMLLANHFLRKQSLKYKKEIKAFDEAAIRKLEAYDWPGNVRELQHMVERAVIMCDGALIEAKHIMIRSEDSLSVVQNQSVNMESIERATIEKALLRCKGNISKAAKELGLGRTTLYRKMARYGL